MSDCIFEIHQLWQSGFSRVYSNCCCSCSFQREIIKIGQSSHKVYSNNILYFQESMTILNAYKKKVWKLIVCTTNAHPRICPGAWNTLTPMGFWYTNGSPNISQITRTYNNQQKKITSRIADFAVPADHWVKLKESKKKDKYLDLARDLKKKQLWNMKVMFIPIVNGALATVTEGLLKGLKDVEIRERMETIQTTSLLRSARILRTVLETWGDLQWVKLQWKTMN